MENKSVLIRLWLHLSNKRQKQTYLLLVLMILSSFGEVISIGAVLPFLSILTIPEKVFNHDLIQPLIIFLKIDEAKQLILPLTILFAIAALLSGFLRLLLIWFQTKFINALAADISIDIYRKTLYQPYNVHLSRNSSEVISGISKKVDLVVFGAILPILLMISSTIMLSSIICFLIFVEPIISLCALVGFGSIYTTVILFSKNILKKNSKKISKEQNKVIKVLQEGLGGIRDVLLDNSQEIFSSIYEKSERAFRKASSYVQIIASTPRFVVETLGMILIAFLAFFLASISNSLVSAIPVLGALVLGDQRLLPLLQQGYSALTNFRGARVSLDDSLKLLDQKIPAFYKANHTKKISFNNSLHFKDVDFRFSDEAPYVLKNINFEIKKGTKIGIFGSTGSGKSTLLDLIMKLLEPNNGSVLIDGVEINSHNSNLWQSTLSHVPQSIFLADTSISENIAFGIEKHLIDQDKVKRSAEIAQISEAIEKLDKKYDTLVGERGIRLSGGQRQRIGIARALYKNSKVLIFDEATSALDNETESKVMTEISKLENDITLIIVAHRLSTLKKCDKLFRINNGYIEDIESYEKMIELYEI